MAKSALPGYGQLAQYPASCRRLYHRSARLGSLHTAQNTPIGIGPEIDRHCQCCRYEIAIAQGRASNFCFPLLFVYPKDVGGASTVYHLLRSG